ncbi:RES domain-containing protein [Micropruina sp.]|uniref:RES domain-containing protein n=1 Tax=Micropruina sp. TaxID=2737536 RepID=UPI0039E32058
MPTVDGQSQLSSEARSVLYVAANLITAFGEVFGDYPEAWVCPSYRIALVRPVAPLRVLDLRGQGAAMRIGALPSLAIGDYPRARTQEWARAIYEDQPVAGERVRGVYCNAAHTNGPALALWDTAGDIDNVRDRRGIPQDLALTDPRIWPRIVAAATRLRISADLQDRCSCS